MDRVEIPFDGLNIPASVGGDGDRCLVCINAAQMTMAAWKGVIGSFTDDTGYRLVLFNFPNQGREATFDDALDLAQQTAIVHAVVSHVSPAEKVDLIGCSWGSVVAASYAARHPSRVRRVMLGSFQLGASARLKEFAPEAQRLVATQDKRGIAELFIKAFGGGLTEAYCNAIRRQFEHLNAGEMAQIARQCAEVDAGVDLKTVIPVEAITARIMIVNGADDPLISESDNARIRRELPRADFRVIPSVGHFLHIQQAAIVEDYLSFLQRRSSQFVRFTEEFEREQLPPA